MPVVYRHVSQEKYVDSAETTGAAGAAAGAEGRRVEGFPRLDVASRSTFSLPSLFRPEPLDFSLRLAVNSFDVSDHARTECAAG